MKKKLTLLAFGLLLAVGWTSNASAQKLELNSVPVAKWNVFGLDQEHATQLPQGLIKGQGVMKKAPNRANNDVYANTVYTKAQYSALTYTWYEGPTTSYPSHTASFTDTVTDANQMYWMLRSAYMNKNVPGIRYNDVFEEAETYWGVGHGWNTGTPTEVDANIYVQNSYGRLFAIYVHNFEGTELYSWSAGNTLPSGWSYSGSPSLTSFSYNGSSYYCWQFSNGGIINIPASQLPAEGCRITIIAASQSSTNTCAFYIFNEDANETHYITEAGGTFPNYPYQYGADVWNDYGTLNMPDYNGYSIFLLKLTDFDEIKQEEDEDAYWETYAERTVQYKPQDLIDLFDKYFASIELLTDGLRVGENTETSGTVFAYQGALNRFYFIGKGKTASIGANGSRFTTSGPFYTMYEEFSATLPAELNVETEDLYQNMWTNGEYYPVVHDCETVLGIQHYFSMYGKDTTVYKSVSPMVFYIPDLRSESGVRSYEEDHQPQVGLYRIFLTAETEPSATYAQDSTYTVTLAWTSTLNDMVNNTVPQTYVIYTVTTDSLGNDIYTPLDTLYNPDQLVYTYDVPQTQGSQQIRYVVMGFPIYDEDHPDVRGNDYFFTYSNPDDIQIPGWFDFMVLYRERYESDFIIHEEKNYYRNYLYPTNLAPGTGMTMGQLKQEWPNQTASYTLWRDNTGVAKLEVRGIGNKVYYRIRYYDATQDTTNVNDIAIPNGYQKMPNE